MKISMNPVNLLAVVFMFLASIALTSETDSVALEFVEELRLGRNLSAMALRVASNSQTYRMVAKEAGEKAAWKSLQKEIAAVSAKYQDEWNQNLAFVYGEQFTVEQLKSVMDKKQQSPHFSEMGKKQAEIGAAMQERSNGLLTRVVAEALENLYTRHDEKPG